MSLKAVSWALEQDIPDGFAKLVLIGLCDAHNGKTGRCYPSKKELCKAASCNERTVLRKLEFLQDNGWLEVRPRYDETGRQTSNEYYINFDGGEGDTQSPRGDTAVRGEGDTVVTPYELEEGTGNTTLQARAREFLIPPNLSDKLCEAAGITDETKSVGLLVLSEPLNWIENGCDLELDILPAIRSRARPGITSWAYFRKPVYEAKAAREAPPPKVSGVSKTNGSGSVVSIAMQELREMQANGE